MIVSINQPAYLSWLGYFHRIAISDVHVILDHVQFEKNSFTNRNKIRTREGSIMLTVPLKTKGLFGDLAINNIEIAEDIWRVKHWKTIQSTYAKAAFFKAYEDILHSFYAQPYRKLIDLILPMNVWMLKELNIHTKLVRSSELECEGSKSDLVLNLCKSLNATTYLSGPIGRDYLNMESFDQTQIKVAFHNYIHPVYPQLYQGFEPYMALLDLLLNHGPAARTYLIPENEKNV